MLRHRVKANCNGRGGEFTVQTGRVRPCLHIPKKNRNLWRLGIILPWYTSQHPPKHLEGKEGVSLYKRDL